MMLRPASVAAGLDKANVECQMLNVELEDVLQGRSRTMVVHSRR